jgi:prepilin-type N-terminal cleavage/methylation domain-containing protein
MRVESDNGFVLVEVMVAALILSIAVAGAAALCVTAVGATRTAKSQTLAILLAVDKLDALRASPPAALMAGGSLDHSEPAYVDYLDGQGRVTGDGPDPSAEAVYIRRWRIQPLPDDPANTSILQVLVRPRATTVAPEDASSISRLPGDALLVSLRTVSP